MRSLVILCTWLDVASAFYSIYYYSTSSNVIMNAGSVFTDAPHSNQVADIYTRMSGLTPLLHEDEVNMPTLLDLSGKEQRPYIFEIVGGVIPRVEGMAPVIAASAFDYQDNNANPALSAIVEALGTHQIELVEEDDFKTVKIGSPKDMVSAVASMQSIAATRPIVILHHETPASHHYIHKERILRQQSSSSSKSVRDDSSTVTPLTEFEISNYQICLWTGVIFVLLLLASICGMMNMEVIPDSLLYAKFQSGRTGGKYD